MNFPKANSFDSALVSSKIMGPNPLKLCEELLENATILDIAPTVAKLLGAEPHAEWEGKSLL